MPVQSVNINKVSMDYFLRGVDAAKPKGVQQVPQGADAGGRKRGGCAAGERKLFLLFPIELTVRGAEECPANNHKQ